MFKKKTPLGFKTTYQKIECLKLVVDGKIVIGLGNNLQVNCNGEVAHVTENEAPCNILA